MAEMGGWEMLASFTQRIVVLVIDYGKREKGTQASCCCKGVAAELLRQSIVSIETFFL